MRHTPTTPEMSGILLVNKPQGRTSFSLVRALRRHTGIQKIGHAGTLDPFATGVMVLLLSTQYTRLSNKLIVQDKEYIAEVHLGVSTDTFDCDGKIVGRSKKLPTIEEIELTLAKFQGEIDQIPPMYSAKKIGGKKLYELARNGETIPRLPAKVSVETTLLEFSYPYLHLKVACSKGTYIRSLADEIGKLLGCGAHLSQLKRTRSGTFHLEECIEGNLLFEEHFDITPYLRKLPHADIQ